MTTTTTTQRAPIEVRHFFLEHGTRHCSTLTEFLRLLKIGVPVDMNPERCGVGGVKNGELVHGPYRLAVVTFGHGRGNDTVHRLELNGVVILAEYVSCENPNVSHALLLVTKDSWRVRWATTRQPPFGQERTRVYYGVADATGQHMLNLPRRSTYYSVNTQDWAGMERLPMPTTMFWTLFDRRLRANAFLRGLDMVDKEGVGAAA